MKLRGTVTSVNPHHLSVLYSLLTLGFLVHPGLLFRVRYGQNNPYLRWVALCHGFVLWGQKTRARCDFLEVTTKSTALATWTHLPEICRRKLETFRFAPLTRTWGKRRRAGVLALLHVASRGIRVKLNAISLRLVPVGKPAHDNLKLVNTLLLKMGTNMYKFHQVISETGRLLWLGSSKPNRCARNADVTRSSSSLSWKG